MTKVTRRIHPLLLDLLVEDAYIHSDGDLDNYLVLQGQDDWTFRIHLEDLGIDYIPQDGEVDDLIDRDVVSALNYLAAMSD